MQRCANRRWNFYAVPVQQSQRLIASGFIRHGRAAGNHRRVIAGNIADGQGQHLRRVTSGGQSSAFDAREVFTHGVHLADRRTTSQQFAVDALLVGQRQAQSRHGQERRTAAGNQTNDQIIFAQTPAQRQQTPGSIHAGLIRHRVGRFHHFYALRQTRRARRRVVVARDHQSFQGRISRPQAFQGMRHGARCLASAKHNGSSARRWRQQSRHIQQRLGTRDRSVKQMA